MKKSIILIVLILIADQLLKFWIKTTMHLGEEITVVDDWFKIHFIENNGMAFGMQFAGEWGKLVLTLFRIVAVGGIGYLLWYLNKKQESKWLLLSWSLILAGALGNIIDSCFYGQLFSESGYFSSQVATFLPAEGGYAPFFHGKVVDMFYFPLIEISAESSSWLPNFLVGYDHQFIFFRPIFNIADAAISVGVALLLVLQILFERKRKKEASKAS